MVEHILSNTDYVTEDKWIITLIRCGNDQHAMIAIEGRRDNEIIKYLIDLRAPGSKTPLYATCEVTSYLPHIKLKGPENEYFDIKYSEKSASWIIDSNKINHMMEKIAREGVTAVTELGSGEEIIKAANKSSFNLFGRYNFFNSISGMFDKRTHSCVTWAIEVLKFSGISLDTGLNINLFTLTSDILKLDAHQVNIFELFSFSAKGDSDSISLHYPFGGININCLQEGAHLGSVASYLGHYSPLMLAAAYGNLDTVKLLVERYNADINLLGGRSRDHTALDCAQHTHWFGISPKAADKIEIITFLQEKGAISGKEQRKVIQELCYAASNGDNEIIVNILKNKPNIQVNQTVSDALYGLWASYLGVYSPLMTAVVYDKFETVKLLVEEYKADVNQLNGRGLDRTVLDYSLHYEYNQISQYLREKGAVIGNEAIQMWKTSPLIATSPADSRIIPEADHDIENTRRTHQL